MCENDGVLNLDSDMENDFLGSGSERGRNFHKSSVASTNVNDTNISMAKDEMMSLLKEIRDSQCTKNDFHKYSQAIKNQFDDVDQKMSKNTAAIETMDSRISKIEKALKQNATDAELSKQNAISRNLSIMGVPPTENEDLTSLALKIFSLVGCELRRSDVFGCYRIKKGTSLTNIFIVKINDFAVKHNILKSKSSKEVKLMNIMKTNTENGNKVIYINNHVTPFFGKLLTEGRKAVKDKIIHSVWLNKNGCQLRLEADGPERTCNSLEELISLIANQKGNSVNNQSAKNAKRTRSADDGFSPKNVQKHKK